MIALFKSGQFQSLAVSGYIILLLAISTTNKEAYLIGNAILVLPAAVVLLTILAILILDLARTISAFFRDQLWGRKNE